MKIVLTKKITKELYIAYNFIANFYIDLFYVLDKFDSLPCLLVLPVSMLRCPQKKETLYDYITCENYDITNDHVLCRTYMVYSLTNQQVLINNT